MLEKHHIDKVENRRLKLEGKKFGRLKVLRFYDVDPKRRESRWICKCDCGNEVIAVGYRLTSGKTRSCGCLNKEITIATSTTHGLSHEKLYFVWKAMIARCENSKNPRYKDYGGRGVKVYSEWHDVQKFIEWANVSGYKEGLEIDRIDNDGNYEPNNCRWATRETQTRNTRRNINVLINGEIKTLTEWAKQYNLKVNTVQYRYYRGDRGERLIRPVTKRGDARCL